MAKLRKDMTPEEVLDRDAKARHYYQNNLARIRMRRDANREAAAEYSRARRAAAPGAAAAYMRERRALLKGTVPGLPRTTRLATKPLKSMTADELKEYRSQNSRRCYEKNLAKIQAKRETNREQAKEYAKAYYAEHREEKLIQRREYRQRPEIKARRKALEGTPEFKAKHSAEVCAYIKRNQEKVTKRSREWRARTNWDRKYYRHKVETDLSFRLRMDLRNRLRDALRNKRKTGSAVVLLGCSIDDLVAHLERQFKSGMNWGNWSLRGWHIDHRTALARFNLTDPEQLKAACHFTNLQPLWAAENIAKGARQ